MKRKSKNKRVSRRYSYSLTGEDIAMFQEKELASKYKKKKNTCDSHIDGA